MKNLNLLKKIQVGGYIFSYLVLKTIGWNIGLSMFIIYFSVCLLAGYGLLLSTAIAVTVGGGFYICNCPINKYLTYNYITGSVHMRMSGSKEFKGKNDLGKLLILRKRYINGIEILKKKKFVRKINFITHEVVLTAVKGALKKRENIDNVDDIIKEEYIGSSPVKEKLYLCPISELKEFNFDLLFENEKKYKVELKVSK